jgi:hypothetical protein
MMHAKSILVLCVVLLVAPQRIGIYLSGAAGPAPGLIKISDLTCSGVFLGPYMPTASPGYTTTYPIGYRYESGARHYFQFAADGHLYEYPEPTPSSCATAVGSITQATVEGWGGDWGTIPVNAGDNYIPNQNSVFAQGLYWNEAASQLFLSWYASYAAVLQHNTLAAWTLTDAGHTTTLNGCWGFDTPYNMTQVGSGILTIPSQWVTDHLAAGRNLAVGFGGPIGYAPANSYGPVLVAINPPANNACASVTDYFLSSLTELEKHNVNNSTGPNCAPSGSQTPATLGCTPATAPTTPYSAQIGFANYSDAMYTTTWDPYGGHGWFSWETSHAMGWYDDGVKHGMVVPYQNPSGWLSQTVLGSPAPTFNGTSGTFSIASTSTHDGYNVNPGDLLWVKTCILADGAGCTAGAIGNQDDLSFVRVDSVNTGTGAIAFTTTDFDFGTGDHKPVVGGGVFAGAVYAHGSPTSSRYAMRMQIYNPDQYAEVIATTRQPYNVIYAEDGDFVSQLPTFGSPSAGSGVKSSAYGGPIISGVMVDPTHHQLMIAVSRAKLSGFYASAIFIYNVSQSTPDPLLAGVNLAMLLMGAFCLPSVLPLRRRTA